MDWPQIFSIMVVAWSSAVGVGMTELHGQGARARRAGSVISDCAAEPAHWPTARLRQRV